MLRLCVRNLFTHNSALSQSFRVKELNSNLKNFGICKNNIRRHFAGGVKEDEKLVHIYYGPLTPQIRAVKIFSLSSSIAGLLAQPIIIKEANAIGSTSLLIALCSVVGFFTFVTPLLLHFVTKKYVTDIHYDAKTSTYKATTINFFLARKQHDFKVEDIEVPEIPGMFTTLKAKGKALFIEARHFNDPSHYAKMMGYDKPIDFKMGEPKEQTQETNK